MSGQGQIQFPEEYSAHQMSLVYQQLKGLINAQNSTIINQQQEIDTLKKKVAGLGG